MPRHWPRNAQFRTCFKELRRYSDAAELRDAVRFADVFPSPAVLVDGINVEVAMRVPGFVRLYRARDVDLPAGVKVRRETVMGFRIRCDKTGPPLPSRSQLIRDLRLLKA